MMIILFRDNVSAATIYSAHLTGFISCFYSVKTNVTTSKKTSQKKVAKKQETKNKKKQNNVGRFSDG